MHVGAMWCQSVVILILIVVAPLSLCDKTQNGLPSHLSPIYFKNDESEDMKGRYSRDSQDSGDPEFYTLEFPKRYFPTSSTPIKTNGKKGAIVFPEVQVPEIPERFSRPSVNSQGDLVFTNLASPQAMAGRMSSEAGSLKQASRRESNPEAGQNINQGLEQQLIDERVAAFTEWILKNNLGGSGGAKIVATANSDGSQSDYALTNGGVLQCQNGQILRNGHCEESANF